MSYPVFEETITLLRYSFIDEDGNKTTHASRAVAEQEAQATFNRNQVYKIRANWTNAQRWNNTADIPCSSHQPVVIESSYAADIEYGCLSCGKSWWVERDN